MSVPGARGVSRDAHSGAQSLVRRRGILVEQPRTSIAGMMAAICIVGVGVAALARPSALWASGIYSAVAALLLVAVVSAANSKGRRRAFWSGFAAFGWGHQFLAFWPSQNATPAPRLLTTYLLDMLHFVVTRSSQEIPAYLSSQASTVSAEAIFYQIGLSLMGLILASLAGLIASGFVRGVGADA